MRRLLRRQTSSPQGCGPVHPCANWEVEAPQRLMPSPQRIVHPHIIQWLLLDGWRWLQPRPFESLELETYNFSFFKFSGGDFHTLGEVTLKLQDKICLPTLYNQESTDFDKEGRSPRTAYSPKPRALGFVCVDGTSELCL